MTYNKIPALAAVLAGLAAPAVAAPVIWQFHETAITACAGNGNACTLPPPSFSLATLTLPGETSSGSASFNNFGGGGPLGHTSQGDDFTLGISVSKPVSQTEPVPDPACCAPFGVVHFDISWTELAGMLEAISINFLSATDSARITLTSAVLGSDNILGGCEGVICTVAGFWSKAETSPTPAPEPGSLGLLAGALFLAAGLRRRARA